MARIGLIQVDNRMDKDITARQDVLISLAEKCLADGADLVFFPEAFQYVYHREVIRDKDAFRKFLEQKTGKPVESRMPPVVKLLRKSPLALPHSLFKCVLIVWLICSSEFCLHF